jgi:hypothetical protein
MEKMEWEVASPGSPEMAPGQVNTIRDHVWSQVNMAGRSWLV